MHDVIIIGGGPAGMTAAIYGARKHLDLAIISPDVGGQAVWASEIQNYLGFVMISGFDLATKFEEHVREFGIEICTDRVTSVTKQDNTFLTKTDGDRVYESRTVVVASGRSARNLGVPGEEEYKGRGVAYCATCDAPLFAGEDVAVVGGGNAGLSAAIQLCKIAKQVYLIEELPKLTGDPILQKVFTSSSNVRILTHTEVTAITGKQLVEAIEVHDLETDQRDRIAVTGVFVEIGSMPNTSFLPTGVEMDEYGEVVVDCSNYTNIPGLFAAGDVTNVPHKQIIVAAGEGCKALLTAYDYIVRTFHEAVARSADKQSTD